MNVRRVQRVVGGLVASATMVVGLAAAGTGTAVAADRYTGPTLETEQGDFGGKNLELTLTNPRKAEGAFSETACTSALLDGQQGLDAFVAYNAQDYGKLVSIITAPGLRIGPAASNSLLSPGPNSNSRTVQVDEGVYIFLGTCGGWNSVLDPSNVGVSMQVVIVPDGIGSLSPALAFGSTALEAGVDLASLLPLIGSIGGGAGS
ncbi:hypothetical protein ABEU20_001159 [Rhodococcus sp. PAM 2766]|uniref:Secreted protein n=1 Tax=Rhodococcus parequi TaxID=3137122 RepID=A0ABW9FAS0_9NOCA